MKQIVKHLIILPLTVQCTINISLCQFFTWSSIFVRSRGRCRPTWRWKWRLWVPRRHPSPCRRATPHALRTGASDSVFNSAVRHTAVSVTAVCPWVDLNVLIPILFDGFLDGKVMDVIPFRSTYSFREKRICRWLLLLFHFHNIKFYWMPLLEEHSILVKYSNEFVVRFQLYYEYNRRRSYRIFKVHLTYTVLYNT